MKKKFIRIANISGFYGDRLSAAKEMVEVGNIDFITGDYLAELTMAILYKSKIKNPKTGYAVTFLKQMNDVMAECLNKKIRIVANAGGMNPKSLAKEISKLAKKLKINPKIASIEGDDLTDKIDELNSKGENFKHLDKPVKLLENKYRPLSANVYLGCWGIVEALKDGADIVITGRIADTSLTMGPAAYHFEWKKNDWNKLSGAAIAGHIIECSGQATGGNYSNFEEIPSFKNIGFPIAEIFNNGESIITKNENTGGIVNVGTITSQLLYEIDSPEYITPDVISHFNSINIKQISKNQVKVSNPLGSPPTKYSKVTINCNGGYKNSMTFLIVGLDIIKKTEILKECIIDSFNGIEFNKICFQFFPTHKENPNSNEEAMARLHVTVSDPDIEKAGKFFNSKIVETALTNVPGICWAHPPSKAKEKIIHFPTLINKKFVKQKITIDKKIKYINEILHDTEIKKINTGIIPKDFNVNKIKHKEGFFGDLFSARSGDKGGNANIGVWGKNIHSYSFLKKFLSVKKLKELLPETSQYKIDRHEFPNLLGLNFYIIGFLGDGISASIKFDGQAKTLGEYLRSKKILYPEILLKD
ncbi:MAG: DUF1446 domain-containing protein [Flavobacteriaceae bacterium]|nr:DUF1446 domain-containing protein [Flavobacteriaceae bacterium]